MLPTSSRGIALGRQSASSGRRGGKTSGKSELDALDQLFVPREQDRQHVVRRHERRLARPIHLRVPRGRARGVEYAAVASSRRRGWVDVDLELASSDVVRRAGNAQKGLSYRLGPFLDDEPRALEPLLDAACA